MGGERFDTPQPEAYLFGENADLNFLGSRPTAVKACKTILIHDTRLKLKIIQISVSLSTTASK
jgi:hypothetical protein